MKSLRIILPLSALATAAITIAQTAAPNPFAVAPDRVEKIKAAMPASTPAPVKKKHEVLVFTKTTTFRHGSIPSGVECMKQLGAKSGLFNVTHGRERKMVAPDQHALAGRHFQRAPA